MLNYLLLVIIALIPLGMVTSLVQDKLTIIPLLGLLVFGIWVIKLGIEKRPLTTVPEFKWLAGLAAVMIIACIAGSNVRHGFYVFKTYLQLFLLFFLITQVFKEKKDLFLTGWVLIVSLTIVAFIFSLYHIQFIEIQGGLASISGEDIHTSSTSLDKGIDPNYFALYFSLAIPFTLYYIIIYKNTIIRTLLIACLIILVSGIVLSQSMGGCVGLISIITLFLILQRNITLRQKVVLFASFIPILIFMYSLAPTTLISRAQNQYRVVTSEDFTTWGSGRGGLWLAALNIIKQNPFLGAGMGGYIDSMDQQTTNKILGAQWMKAAKVAHNSFLGIAAENGIVGLVLFLILAGSLLKRSYGELKRLFIIDKDFSYFGHAIFLSLVCFLIQAMFLDVERDKYLWILLAIAAIFTNIATDVFLKGKELKRD